MRSLFKTSCFSSTPKGILLGLKAYPFSFNGMEQDNEINGSGNVYDFGARIYDSRLGKWFSCDPMQEKYPNYSPYNYSLNSPVMLGDPDGNWVQVKTTRYKLVDGQKVKISAIKSIFVKADIIERQVIIHQAKVIDLTGEMGDAELKMFASSVQKEISNNWSTSNDPDANREGYVTNSKGQKIKITTTFKDDIQIPERASDIESGDNVFAVVWESDNRVQNGEASGTAFKNGALSYISLTSINKDGSMNEKTLITHESGHWGGLPDSQNPNDKDDKIMYNLTGAAAVKPHPNEYTKFYKGGTTQGVNKNAIDLRESE